MHTSRLHRLGISTLLLAALAVAAPAQIKDLTLEEMGQIADQAVYGQITGARVFHVDSPVDGVELYHTTLTVQGRLLSSGQPTTVDITFRGGFLDGTPAI